jgi:hypothetical protein
MRSAVRFVLLLLLVIPVSGCKVALTNRFEMRDNGSVAVHVVQRLDDQLYALGASRGYADWGKPKDGWAIKKYATEDGDHVVDASRQAASLDEAVKVVINYYASEAPNNASLASGLPSSFDPSRLHFDVQSRDGLFTKTYSIRADVPQLIPDDKELAVPGVSPLSSPFGAQMLRSMIAGILSLHTEIKLPGTIVSTNGERLADGSIRFTHSLTSPSHIDLVDEAPDFLRIGMGIFIGLAFSALAVFRFVGRREATPPLGVKETTV